MGEAAILAKDGIADQVHGVGIPPLTELMEFAVANDVPISV